MESNPMLEEIWRIKDELAREAGDDIHRLCRNILQWEAKLRVWVDEWAIHPENDIYPTIERGLEAPSTLVLSLSRVALGLDWVRLERKAVLFRDPFSTSLRFIPRRLRNDV
jgi:hypothetical protein